MGPAYQPLMQRKAATIASFDLPLLEMKPDGVLHSFRWSAFCPTGNSKSFAGMIRRILQQRINWSDEAESIQSHR